MRFHKFNQSFLKNNFTFVVTIVVLVMLAKLIGSFFGGFLVPYTEIIYPSGSDTAQTPELTMTGFIGGIIIVPALETFLGQLLPVYFIGKVSRSKRLQILLSAVVFACLHLPVLWFLPSAFLVGMVLSWGYVIRKTQRRHPFLTIAFCHGLVNLIAFTVFYFYANSFK